MNNMDDFVSEIVIYDIESYGDELTDLLRKTYQINTTYDERLAQITQEKIEAVLEHYNNAIGKNQHLIAVSLVHPNKIILPYAFEAFNSDDSDGCAKACSACIDLIININDGLLEYKFNTHTDNRLLASFALACCDIRFLRYEIGKLKK